MASGQEIDLYNSSGWTKVIDQWLHKTRVLDLSNSESLDGLRLRCFLDEASRMNDGRALPSIDATGSTFHSAVSLAGISFCGPMTFADTTFSEHVDFRRTNFGERADFHRAEFHRSADFSDATFSDSADFAGASFGHVADFRRAQFMKHATFAATRFDLVDFHDARFRGTVDFDRIDAATPLPGAPMEASGVRAPWAALAAILAFGLLGLRLGSGSEPSRWLYLGGITVAVMLAIAWLARPRIHRMITVARRTRGRADRILRHSVVDDLLVAVTLLAAIAVLVGVVLDVSSSADEDASASIHRGGERGTGVSYD